MMKQILNFQNIVDNFRKNPRCLFLIQTNVKRWLKRLHNTPTFLYNKQSLHYKSIDVFIPNATKKSDNGSSNEIRESIIGALVNKKIPEKFFKNSLRWRTLNQQIFKYIEDLSLENGGELLENYVNIALKHKGGRTSHYDFEIALTTYDMEIVTYKVEFKFNQDNICKIPEFVQPCKPSQYMSNNFEKDFYDNGYLDEIINWYNWVIQPDETLYMDEIDRDVYLKEVHGPKPACLKRLQEQYKIAIEKQPIMKERRKDNNNFQTFCTNVSKKMIIQFIKKTTLNTDMLTEYFLKHQKNKHYMFYSKNETFVHASFYEEDFILLKEHIINKQGNGYTCKTISGGLINVLLRWKNYNGIAFPAFQISREK